MMAQDKPNFTSGQHRTTHYVHLKFLDGLEDSFITLPLLVDNTTRRLLRRGALLKMKSGSNAIILGRGATEEECEKEGWAYFVWMCRRDGTKPFYVPEAFLDHKHELTVDTEEETQVLHVL